MKLVISEKFLNKLNSEMIKKAIFMKKGIV